MQERRYAEWQQIPRMGTLKEAAALAGIPYSAIRKMCITGKVVHVRVGTKYLVNLDKLAEYLETGDSK